MYATLTFVTPQIDKPWFRSSALTGGDPKLHFATEQHCVEIHDMRLVADRLSLDREGFELHHAPTAVDDLYDDAVVLSIYAAELMALLQHHTGSQQVVIFDVTRRSDRPQYAGGESRADRPPAARAHIDYTVNSGLKRAADAFGQGTVQKLLASGQRIIQINVWRPITGPIKRTPLALAAANSIAATQLIATDQVFPDRVGEIYQLAHAPSQHWYWVSDMATDEVLLIKGWDSCTDGRARFTPHTAFALPGQPPTPCRESIETRAFCVLDGA